MTHKIEVRAKHIKAGIIGSPFRCPIALALKDSNIPNLKVSVGDCFLGKADGIYLTAPTRVNRFIYQFDKRKLVKPFSFTLKTYRSK